GNDTLRGGVGRDTMSGGGGNDTFYIDRTLDQVIEAGDGGYDRVFSPVNFTLQDNIEELILQGSGAINGGGNAQDNLLTGNAAVNRLSGEEGNDTLVGGAGADVLIGGAGDDEYRLDGADTLVERADEGRDLVSTAASHTLQAFFENLLLTGTAAVNGTGNELDNAITGNSAANALSGGDGADTLDGGAGADTLRGGNGDDLYRLSDAGDTIEELADGGQDRVESTVSVTLGAEVENLVLQGIADLNGTGNELANAISGNAGRNVLSGGDGNDGLDGNGGADTLDGGAGDDAMRGGRGGDTYIVDSLADSVLELADEGRDSVASSVDHTLGENVENLALRGGANLEGAGNALPNLITGNSGSNLLEGDSGTDTLSGAGGADTLDGGTGADQMSGGSGNDLYLVDDLGDTATESAGGGFDTVKTLVDHGLSANIEQLFLEGNDPIDGTGNDLANLITGNESDNALSGQGGNDTLDGGAGADAMRGGAGDDLFLVDDAGDTATEAAGEGNDLVKATVSFTLSPQIETLLLLGEDDLDGAGNAQANTITGTIGNNALDGGGGADTLTGGEGDDTYTVDNFNDTIVELADEGNDTVRASIGFTLADNLENLQLLGSIGLNGLGNAIDNLIEGNSGGNLLEGAEGADTLEGGDGSDTLSGGLGLDVLVGGAGDDTYEVDATTVGDELLTDKVIESADGGLDTVQSLISYTLGANVEVLNLGGSSAINGTGNDTANTIVGNFAVNVLSGGAGNDTLSAGFGDDQLDGGSGDDSMSGGLGNDLYIVDSVLDVVSESAAQGTDTVRTSVQVALAANVENLILTGSANIDATGDALDNVLGSNLGNNVIDGGGGTDTVSYADIEARITVDLSKTGQQDTKGAGLDTLISIENATGGKGDDFLIGNSGVNVLDGGAGADTMVGGGGDDILVVDNVNDVATDPQNAGIDTVRSSVSWKLDPAIENLVLTGAEDVDGFG
ncbi:MAG: beta strand repeat-containing protein, partial [Gammaproteobacteria bacterium]